MLDTFAKAGLRRPRRICLAALAVLLLAGAIAAAAPGALRARDPFQAGGSPSARASTQLERATAVEYAPGVLALVLAAPGSVATSIAARTLRRDSAVAHVLIDPAPGRGPTSVIAASLRASAQPQSAVEEIERRFRGQTKALLGGPDVALAQINEQSSQDLSRVALLALPLVALLAFLFFRGVATLLPLAVGAVTITGAFAALVAVNAILPLSNFALNLVLALGIGLSVDYSLFLVWRLREEVARGADLARAIHVTTIAAGRTVAMSALIVIVAGISLLVFPLGFLRSMGIACAIVALVAASVSLTLLPALFALMGPRLTRHLPRAEHEGPWHRLSRAVMRAPGLCAVCVAVALIVLALPGLSAHWSGVDASVLPPSKSARVVSDRLRSSFKDGDFSTMVAAIDAPPSAQRKLEGYARALHQVPGVIGTPQPVYLGGNLWGLGVTANGSAIERHAQRVLEHVRAVQAPFPTAIGGEAAEYADLRSTIAAHAPVALAILVALTLALLWFMTGSVVLPVKALLMTALSVGAATGVLVWIFQDGRLTWLLAYRGQGGIEPTDFLLLLTVAFALSTDYGLFLLARIKEARDAGVGEREAIALGLQRSGRIVSASALLLTVAIGALVGAKLIFLKELGLGAAVAVLVDAFAVRALLVPALMALLGHWNWWQPEVLHRVHARLVRRPRTARESAHAELVVGA